MDSSNDRQGVPMTEHFFDGISELIAGAAVPLILSISASVVRIVRYGWHSWRHMVASVTTSIFVGQVVFWGLKYFDLDASVAAAIVSVSAYMGGSLLDAVFCRVQQEIKTRQLPIGTESGAGEEPK